MANFEERYQKIHGKSPEDNTYSYKEPFEPRVLSDVICCTFHQNSSADAPFERYDEVTYAKLMAICLKEFHELGIPKEKISLNIGYYGDAEVSFSLDMNPNKIEDFQIY